MSNNFGKHSSLQEEAELQAKILIAIWMEEGITEENSFEISHLPTARLKFMAGGVKKTLAAGYKQFHEIAAANPKYISGLAEMASELSHLKADYRKPWLPYIFSVLSEFHRLKLESYAAWGKHF